PSAARPPDPEPGGPVTPYTLLDPQGQAHPLPGDFAPRPGPPGARPAGLGPAVNWLDPPGEPRPIRLAGTVRAPRPELLAFRVNALQAAVEGAVSLQAPADGPLLASETALQPGSGQVAWEAVNASAWRAVVTLYPAGEAP
ncbi:MAG TPA: hypothetical protein VHN99_08885, partial [Deinococcales bacterium]|nr:hypothetical protein [Deinococcales bacterium]